MSSLPTHPPVVGAEAGGGLDPPGSPSSLSGFCDACGKPRPARELHMVLVQRSHAYDPKWNLICGECFTA